MSPTELLLWLSARKNGSWDQFRGAVETLDLANSVEEGDDTTLPVHQQVRFNLERLGHLEFNAAGCENGWRVVPPTLSISHHGKGVTGVLCGARTPKLLVRIQSNAASVTIEKTAHADCPDIIRMQAHGPEPLIELAVRERLFCQLEAPITLLSHLPTIDAAGIWHREACPASGKDWEVRQFIVEKRVIRWQKVTLKDANSADAKGLFCFTRFQIPHYFLRDEFGTIRLPGPIGKYRILSRRKRRIFRYDRQSQTLTIPAILRPPLLMERALILCSGFPPSLQVVYKRPTLTYREVPEEVAGLTAEVLRQDLS